MGLHPIKVGGNLEKMVRDDLQGEYRAIAIYKGYVTLAEREDDPVTRRLYEGTLATEEGHANDWETVLEKKYRRTQRIERVCSGCGRLHARRPPGSAPASVV